MQPRTTVFLFVVAVLLGAFVYLYQIKGEAGRDDAMAQHRRIFSGIDAEAIDTLEFRTQDDRPFKSIRSLEGWRIQTPVDFPGDDIGLDAIASTLANLKRESEIDSPAAPEIYGLGDVAKRIQFEVADQSYVLEIGADTPVGDNVYVRNPGRSDDSSPVYSVPAFRLEAFARDLASLRDRRVLKFDRTRVNRVVAGWPGGSATLVKSAGGWAIASPARHPGPADAKTVDDLLSDVAFLRAEGFVDLVEEDEEAEDRAGDLPKVEQADAKKLHAQPYYSLKIRLDPERHSQTDGLSQAADGLSQVKELPREVGFRVLGDPDGDDYLLSTGKPHVLYRVPRSRIEELPRELFAFRFKELSEFETAQVHSFELVFNPKGQANRATPVSVRVDRIAAGWQAVGKPWVAGAAAGLIAEFARLEAVSLVAEDAAPDTLAALGLFPARTILRAYAAPDEAGPGKQDGGAMDEKKSEPERGKPSAVAVPRKLLAEVRLGDLDPVAGIAAKARGQAAVYRLDPALAEQLPLGLDDYRARFLAPELPYLGESSRKN